MEPTVFIVDDDAGSLKSLEWLVKSMDFQSVACPSPAEFLAQFDPQVPGCLVLDVRMPVMTGLDLQAALAEYDYCPPIIFITGYGDVPTSVRAIKAGAIDYLEKPIKGDVFQERLNEAIAIDLKARKNRSSSPVSNKLTERQRQIMDLLVAGKTIKEISAACEISIQTAAKHRAHIFQKLSVDNDVELVRLVLGASGI